MEKFKDLKNKVILISGATGLIGNNLIKEYLNHEAEVYGIDIDRKKINFQLNEFKKKFPRSKISLLKCDITKENEVKKIIKHILNKSKKIDTLINNAATKTKKLKNFFKSFQDFNLSDWKKIMDVNVNGAFLLSREVSKAMIRKKSGNIISIASIQGVVGNDKSLYKSSKFQGIPMSSPAVYSTSKSALIGLTRYLATYLGEFNIRSNSISPGGIKGAQNKKFIQNYSKKVPLKRMGEVDEIVQCVLFLSSNKSSYISGQNIIVDGGYTSW
jgi:NAD(P)-dependent dehydrogenase (short-subunit alcohol dehydrogenase family)